MDEFTHYCSHDQHPLLTRKQKTLSKRTDIPLWSVMGDLAENNRRTPGWLHALEAGFCPNRLPNKVL
ncbi:hypothetical protein [Serratia proteamaculans]